MNIHVIRSAYYSEEDYKLILQLLRSKPGPLSFTDASEESHSKMWEQESKILADYNQEILSPNQQSELDEITTFMQWDDFFDLCDVYRQEFNLKNDEFVIILTPHHNPKNWFTSFADDRNNIFVHTGDWEYYLPNTPAIFPITYLVVSQVIQKSVYKTVDEKRNYAHMDALGCMNDFCGTKSEINLKLRTADICPDCLEHFTAEERNDNLINQAFSLFEEIRREILFKRHYKPRLSTLHITKGNEIVLVGYNQRINIDLTPLEKTVYFLYLKYPDGIENKNLPNYQTDVENIYRSLCNRIPSVNIRSIENKLKGANPKDIEKAINDAFVKAAEDLEKDISYSVMSLVIKGFNSMSEKRANIKKKFIKALGPDKASFYVVKGAKEKPYKIELERSLITSKSDLYNAADISQLRPSEASEIVCS